MTLSPAPAWTAAPAAPGTKAALLDLAQLLRASDYRFRTVTPATHQRVLARGQQWATDWGDVFGWNLPFRTELPGPERCAAWEAAGVVAAHGDGWKAQWRAAALDDLIVFHSAYPTEQHDAVFLGPDTYRFVSAVRRALPRLAQPPRRVMDLGCGAGSAAIVLASALPNAEVFAGDINAHALALTAINAEIANLNNVRTVTSNLLDGVDGTFDLIVANPPYMLDAQARAYRHGAGAYGEALSVAMVRAGLKRLAPGGTFMLYTGSAFVRQCEQFWRAMAPVLARVDCVFHYEELDPDVFGEELEQPGYADVDRIAAVWLVVTVAG